MTPERMELVTWLTGIIDNSHIDGNTRSAMVKARDLILRDAAAEQRIAQLEAALKQIVEVNQIEQRRTVEVDPAGNTYEVRMIDGPLAVVARNALASRPEPRAPVTLEEIQDPDFTGGLSPTEYLDRLHAGTLGDIQSQAPESQPPTPDYDHLAKTTFWPAEKPPAEPQRRYPGDPEISRAEHLQSHLDVHKRPEPQDTRQDGGWQWVPKEPDATMVEAGRGYMPVELKYWYADGRIHCEPLPRNELCPPEAVYRAMLAAAPLASVPSTGERQATKGNGHHPDRKLGFRDGGRWAITFLHKRGDEMNDPHARAVLNAAAYQMGNDLAALQSPAPESPRVKPHRRYPGDPEISRAEHLRDHLSVHQQPVAWLVERADSTGDKTGSKHVAHNRADADRYERAGHFVTPLYASSPVPPRETKRMMELVARLNGWIEQMRGQEKHAMCAARDLILRYGEQATGEWQNIETAAKDDTPRLLWNGHWRGVGSYQEPYHGDFAGEFGDPMWVDETGKFIEPPPTDWQPLPLPPLNAALAAAKPISNEET